MFKNHESNNGFFMFMKVVPTSLQDSRSDSKITRGSKQPGGNPILMADTTIQNAVRHYADGHDASSLDLMVAISITASGQDGKQQMDQITGKHNTTKH